jgi:hypothetical protein
MAAPNVVEGKLYMRDTAERNLSQFGYGPVRTGTCPFRPEMHGTERPLQNRNSLLLMGFVEAARFLGGQPFGPSKVNLGPRYYVVSVDERAGRGVRIFQAKCG